MPSISSSSKSDDGDAKEKKKPYRPPHAKKPYTERDIATFKARWSNPDLSVAALTKLYGVTDRTLTAWRKAFGLTGRDVLQAVPGDTAALIRQTESMGQTIQEATKDAIKRHQRGNGLLNRWELIPKEMRDPLENTEIKAALEDFKAKARRLDTGTQLLDFQRAAMKVYTLSVALSPLHTWDGLAEMTRGIVKVLDWTRKLEADLPADPKDDAQVRREAATALMRELQAALDPGDRDALAVLVKRGADKIKAQRNGHDVTIPTAAPGGGGGVQ